MAHGAIGLCGRSLSQCGGTGDPGRRRRLVAGACLVQKGACLMGEIVKLGWLFFKIGLIFFGGGYVLIPLLHRIMVDQLHWLTLTEFLDGVALSQLTPGPLAMLATYTGFKAGGIAGAVVSTVFIFLPCTGLMLFLSSRYERL